MKLILFSIFISLVSLQVNAQSLNISEVAETANQINTFEVAGVSLQLDGEKPSFIGQNISADLNPVTALSVSVLPNEGVRLYDTNGKVIQSKEHSFQPDDSSIRVYVRPDGGFVLRENIANFLFFDSFGGIETSISNSSQSTEGEAISELAADPMFKTVVLYNPVIVMDGVEGSRASLVKPNGITINVFNSQDRAIRFVEVSEDGQFVGVISYRNGTDDELTLLDRNGNELNTFSFSQEISDFRISEDGQYLTLRSDGRVGVYSVTSGERLGSTSIRSGSVQFADYVPEEETIIALSASRNGPLLNDIELHAINLAERSIERTAYNSALAVSDSIPLRLERENSGTYRLSGLSSVLQINIEW